MEATEERREFDKVMRKLNDLGSTLKLACEFGGVDANSLNRMKGIVAELNGIEEPEEYLSSFINDWLDLPEFRPILEKWIKRACALFKYSQMEESVNFKVEKLGKDYVEIADTYERWRVSIIYWLCENHLREGEMVKMDGTIYLKEQTPQKAKVGSASKGRRSKSFKECLKVDNKDDLLRDLHKFIDGSKGKDVAIVIRTCCDLGVMNKPTFTQVKNEFGDIGNKSGYNRYMADWKIQREEKQPVIRVLSKYVK